MSVANVNLSLDVKRCSTMTKTVYLNLEVLQIFTKLGISMFPLAPDELGDVKRVPANVDNLSGLLKWIERLSKKMVEEPKLSSEDGTKRTYKMFVIAIHSIGNFIAEDDTEFYLSYSEHARVIMEHSSSNAPVELGPAALVLWNKTQSEGKARLRMCIITILRLSDKSTKIPGSESLTTIQSLMDCEAEEFDSYAEDVQKVEIPEVQEEVYSEKVFVSPKQYQGKQSPMKNIFYQESVNNELAKEIEQKVRSRANSMDSTMSNKSISGGVRTYSSDKEALDRSYKNGAKLIKSQSMNRAERTIAYSDLKQSYSNEFTLMRSRYGLSLSEAVYPKV